MPTNKYSRFVSYTYVNCSRFRISVSFGVCFIEQSKSSNSFLTTLQNQANESFYAYIVVCCCNQPFFYKLEDCFVLISQHISMVGISSHPLQTIGQKFPE